MPEVVGRRSEFILLSNAANRRGCMTGKTVFIAIVVTLPIVIFCGIYTIILKHNDNTVYPDSFFEVPDFWLRRAKLYSSQSKRFHNHDIVLPPSGTEEVVPFKLVCYYNNPENDPYNLQPQNIPPNLCTHINVGFFAVVNSSIRIDEEQMSIVSSVVALKQVNPNLKVLVTVGGSGGDEWGFPLMVYNHTNRKTFIRSILSLVKSHHIDGVDLDWEFPGNDSEDPRQTIHFVQLLEEFRAAMRRHGHYFLVTLAVASPIALIDNYDVADINKYVDYINLMSYDFHFFTKITPFTGINSPLYASSKDGGYFRTLNINYSANYWNFKGMDRRKILIGLPTYGHTFRLMNVHNNALFAPSRSVGKLGHNGFADYTQICQFLDMNEITPIWDADTKSPYAYKGPEWISFDNEQSFLYKVEYIRANGFGGAMLYALNSDDHSGLCTPKKFPLTEKAREILNYNYSIF